MQSQLTRRAFVARADVAGGLLALARPVGAAGQAGAAAAGMFVSLNGSLTRGVSGAEKARLAAKLGYGGVDSGSPHQPGRQAWSRARALFAELNIKPSIVGLPLGRPLPFGGEPAAFEDALKGLADDAAFVSAVGCTRMMLVLSPAGPTAKEEYGSSSFSGCLLSPGCCRKRTCDSGWSFSGRSTCASRALMARRACRSSGRFRKPWHSRKESGPNVGVVLDVWHWHHSGGTIAGHSRHREVADRPRAHLRCAAEASRRGSGQHALHAW